MVMIFGHRGARGEAPENTLTGFLYAKGIGVEAFELDVQLSADDQLVVIHDRTVDRTTDGTGPVSSLTVAELAVLDARAAFPDWPEPAGVPTLADILDVVADAVRFEVEIKTDLPERLERVVELLLPTLKQNGIAERTTVSSFDSVALEIVQRLAPEQARGFISRYDDMSYLETAVRLGCTWAEIPIKTGSAEIVRAAKERGLRVVGWQGNSEEDIDTLLAWDVDVICTDYPSIAMAYLVKTLPYKMCSSAVNIASRSSCVL
ncbi:MAG: glycerophosphodiester phosphodiesterase [Thermomicrobiales bacterium]